MRIRIDMRHKEMLVPEGQFQVEVNDVTMCLSRDGENLYLSFLLNIVEGEYRGNGLWMIASLKEARLLQLRDTLRALGIDDEEVEFLYDAEKVLDTGDRAVYELPASVTSPDFIGRRALATVTHERWRGKTQARVWQIDPLSL